VVRLPSAHAPARTTLSASIPRPVALLSPAHCHHPPVIALFTLGGTASFILLHHAGLLDEKPRARRLSATVVLRVPDILNRSYPPKRGHFQAARSSWATSSSMRALPLSANAANGWLSPAGITATGR